MAVTSYEFPEEALSISTISSNFNFAEEGVYPAEGQHSVNKHFYSNTGCCETDPGNITPELFKLKVNSTMN